MNIMYNAIEASVICAASGYANFTAGLCGTLATNSALEETKKHLTNTKSKAEFIGPAILVAGTITSAAIVGFFKTRNIVAASVGTVLGQLPILFISGFAGDSPYSKASQYIDPVSASALAPILGSIVAYNFL